MKNVEITVEKWVTAGVVSAVLCAGAVALARYALGFWNCLLVTPIGFVVGATVQKRLDESAGRWPARTAAVLTLLAEFLGKAGGFYLALSLDPKRGPEVENGLLQTIFDDTFSGFDRVDVFFFALSPMVAFVKAIGSEPGKVRRDAPYEAGEQDREFSEMDRKEIAVAGYLMLARVTMVLVGALTAYSNAQLAVNARMTVSKAAHQQLRGIPADQIDHEFLEQLKDEEARSVRLWSIGFCLVGITTLVAGIVIHRYPIAANTTALVLFAGSWAIDALVLGTPMSPLAIVIKIVVIMVFVLALHACIQFKRECMRLIESAGSDSGGEGLGGGV